MKKSCLQFLIPTAVFHMLLIAEKLSYYRPLYSILLFENYHLWRGESNEGENSFFFPSDIESFGFRDIFFFIILNYYPSFNSRSFPCMLGKLAVINHTLNGKKNEMHPKPFFTKRRKVDAKYLNTCNKFILFYSLSHKHDV